MSNAAYVGSLTSGHDFCQPTEIVSGSQNVFINNKPAARVGDKVSCMGAFTSEIISGSENIFID